MGAALGATAALGFIAFYLVWCLMNTAIARQKNRSEVAAFFLSLLLTPLMPFLYLLAVPAKPAAEGESTSRTTAPATKIFAAVIVIIMVGVFMRAVEKSATPSGAGTPSTVSTAGIVASAPRAPSTSRWHVGDSRSPMDDSRGVSLSLDASDPITAWPGESFTPTLVIRCREHKTAVFIRNGCSPNVEYGLSGQATVRLRLDSAPAQAEVWTESTDKQSLFSPTPIPLARRLSKAQRLTYEFTPFNSSQATTTFDLAGLDSLISQVSSCCGWR